YGDNLCSDGKTVWKSSAPCETDTGTVQVGYFGNKVIAVSYGGTLQLFGYKGTPLAKAPARNNGGHKGGGGLGLFPGIGGSSPAGASSGSAAADAKQNSSIANRALQLLLGQGHGGGGGGGSGGGSGGGVGGSAGDLPACADTDPDTGTTPF